MRSPSCTGACACLLIACSGPAPVLERFLSIETEELGPILARRLDPLISGLWSEPSNAEIARKARMPLQAYEQHQLAVGFFTRANALARREFRWEHYRGTSLGRLVQHDQVAVSLRRCIQLDADFLPGRLRLAERAFESDDEPVSLAMYRDLAEIAPDDARIQCGLGRSEAAAGEGPPRSRRILGLRGKIRFTGRSPHPGPCRRPGVQAPRDLYSFVGSRGSPRTCKRRTASPGGLRSRSGRSR